MRNYKFSTSWFEQSAQRAWENLIPQLRPQKMLEVGSFEGASACFLIDKLASKHDIELYCVDTWGGGIEHQEAHVDMHGVEQRFQANVDEAIRHATKSVRLELRKGHSDHQLAKLLAEGKAGYFDFVYIDGSHQAPDVLCDAVLGFKLLRVGGLMAFDDYLWSENKPAKTDVLRCPKIAIDAFVTINSQKIRVLPAPLYQLYVHKLSD